MDPGHGARLPELCQLKGLELKNVEVEPHAAVGGSPLATMMRLSTEQLGNRYVQTGLADPTDVKAYLAFANSPHCWAVYYTTYAVVAQRQ